MRPTICVSSCEVGLRPLSFMIGPDAATANGEIITASTTVARRTLRVRGDLLRMPTRNTDPVVRLRAVSERGRYARRHELHDQEPQRRRGLRTEVRVRRAPGGALRRRRARRP